MAGGGGFDPSAWLWTACAAGVLILHVLLGLMGLMMIFPSAFREWWPSVFSNFGPDARPLQLFVYRGEGTIPEDVEVVEFHRSVTEIPDYLFAGCNQLESLILHPGLLRIGSYAFEGCSSLIRVEIPYGLMRIGVRAFARCASLQSFRCPATVTEIGEFAFDECSNLEEVVLPDGLEEIDFGTFEDCTSLEEVRIPASVARIGREAFSGCRNLRLVDLREGLRWIGWTAFYGCSSLERLLLPFTVEEVHHGAFWDCSSLSLVQLHEDLERMGPCAFRGCTLLERTQFIRLSERIEAISMDDQSTAMFEDRLREITAAMTEVVTEEGDDYWVDWDQAEALWGKCKRSLERAHEALDYLEFKRGVMPVLKLALWRAQIENEVRGGGREEVANNGEGGHDLNAAERDAQRRDLARDIDHRSGLSREECLVKSGSGIVVPGVLNLLAVTWPQLSEFGVTSA